MASEYTDNYNLDLYTGTDKPNLRDQYNAAMGKIDKELKTVADSGTSNANLLAQLNRDFTGVKASADSASAAATAAQSAAESAEETAQEAKTAADAATKAASATDGKLASYAPKLHAVNGASTYGGGTSLLYGHVKVLDSPTLLDDAASSTAASGKAAAQLTTSLNALDTRVQSLEKGSGAQYAPIKHDSTASTYGIGTANNYGHVKLVDAYNANASTAATGTAASGAALNSLYQKLNTDIEAQTELINGVISRLNAAPTSCGVTTANAGITTNSSTFFTHLGIVVVKLNVTPNQNLTFGGAAVQIGMINAGYRPTARISTVLTCTAGGVDLNGWLSVNANGQVVIQIDGAWNAALANASIIGDLVYLSGVNN